MFAATNICRHKHVFVATTVLSGHAYFCRDKRRILSRQILFVATNVSHDKVLVRKNILSRQTCFRVKTLVMTSILLSREKTSFVATKDIFCRDKHVFVTKKLSSRQIFFLWQPFCPRQKMILEAAPANDVCEQQQYENCGVAVNQLSLLGWSQRHANKLTSDT